VKVHAVLIDENGTHTPIFLGVGDLINNVKQLRVEKIEMDAADSPSVQPSELAQDVLELQQAMDRVLTNWRYLPGRTP
jgi:hypothetical protein